MRPILAAVTRHLGWGALAVAVLLTAGCAARGARVAGSAAPPAALEEVVRFFDGHSGRALTWDEVIDRAVSADVVLIGEVHRHPTGLAMAARIWEEIAARGEAPALSLEFFDRGTQVALDDYLAGITDEDEFREAARRNEKNYPDGHRRMVETARARHLPVIAANAPRRYVSLARERDLDALAELNERQRGLFDLPPHDLEGRYREDFDEAMSPMFEDGSHEGSGDEAASPLDGYFRSMLVWDATMAHSIARAARSGRRPVVHVVGAFHVAFAGGTRAFLEELMPAARIVGIVAVPETASELGNDERGAAEIVAYVGPGPDD